MSGSHLLINSYIGFHLLLPTEAKAQEKVEETEEKSEEGMIYRAFVCSTERHSSSTGYLTPSSVAAAFGYAKGNWRLAWSHLKPNTLPSVITTPHVDRPDF
ncbi:hypothetical protein C8R44DRAFT_750450 [Mycena epipterygia]|nr:hypothetical protein C8R44DRAFT_750450 [Mycena epipterygia]